MDTTEIPVGDEQKQETRTYKVKTILSFYKEVEANNEDEAIEEAHELIGEELSYGIDFGDADDNVELLSE